MSQQFQPMYLQVVDKIKKEIISGELKPGELLPSELEYAKELGVSRVTLRQSFALLQKQGFIIRRKALGTCIAERANYNKHLQADIAIIIPDPEGSGYDPSNLFFSGSDFSFAIKHLTKLGMNLHLLPFLPEIHKPEEMAFKNGIDGFIVVDPHVNQDIVNLLISKKIPHVTIESAIHRQGTNAVIPGDADAAEKCVELLSKKGRQQLAFVSGLVIGDDVPNGNWRRLQGFKKAADTNKIVVKENCILSLPGKPAEINWEQGIMAWLQGLGENLPDGIVASTVEVAECIMHVASNMNLSIPENLSLVAVDVSFSNNRRSKFDLSGFVKNRRETGIAGADLLLRWIREPRFKPQIRTVSHLLVSGSTL